MRVKPILKYGLRGRRACAAGRGVSHSGSASSPSSPTLGQPLSARIELLAVVEGRARLACRRRSPIRRSTGRTTCSTRACCRARASRSSAARTTPPICKVTSTTPGERALPRPAGRGELGVGPRRARLHVPARSAGHASTPPVEPITPVRAGTRAAPRARTPRRAAAAAPAARRRAARRRATRTRSSAATRCRRSRSEYKPETVTLDQMLVALFKSNQNAFDGNNMNRLRSGAIITIPNAADASAASPHGGHARSCSVQASDWRAYRDRVAGAAPMADEAGTRAAGGRIGTAVQETHARRASGQRPAARVEGRRRRQGRGRGRERRRARRAAARRRRAASPTSRRR